MYINIIDTENKKIDIKFDNIIKKYTDKQTKKQKLILRIKEKYLKGKSMRFLAKKFELNRATISKYVNTKNVEETSVYDSSNRNYGYLNTYKDEIIDLYSQTKNMSEVHRKLKSKIDTLKYSTLRRYILKFEKEDLEKDKNKTKAKNSKK